MPSFLFTAFAIAGAAAAAGPIIIHLLNRRRFRVVNWAAMDFLREAMQRNRRILQMRDIILLALRTAAVLLLGFALARPFFSSDAGAGAVNEPLHAVLLVDNSLSMGYVQQDNATLLEEAKNRAAEYINLLPSRSVVSVIPLCDSRAGFTFDPYRTKEDAIAAVQKVEVVDRPARVSDAVSTAREACRLAPDVPAKRVVLLGDQQEYNWSRGDVLAPLEGVAELQVVDIAAREAENSWIADFRLRDGVADVDSAAVFIATVRHEGAPRSDVQVTLTVDGDVKTKTINLEGKQQAEVTFEHRFDNAPEPGKTNLVVAKVSLPPDRLKIDDERSLVVPVVAALPVVFVDALGDEEQSNKSRLGETYFFRKILAPLTARNETVQQLIQIQRVRVDQVDRKLLQEARLVVMAGLSSPESLSPLLRDYVRQGGNLVIAAGGDFSPADWNRAAWNDGAGILPVRLKNEPVGRTPEESPNDVRPFFLDFDSLSDGIFRLPEVPEKELAATYSEAFFFKAIDSEVADRELDEVVAAEAKRIAEERRILAELDARDRARRELQRQGKLDQAQTVEQNKDDAEREELQPSWLSWTVGRTRDDSKVDPTELARLTRPRVKARFTNGAPALVERSLGQGRVLFFASSGLATWHTMPKTNAWFLFDRIFREMLERTLEPHNYSTAQPIVVPIEPADRLARFRLQRPDGSEQIMDVDALGGDNYGLTIRDPLERGVYTLVAKQGDDAGETKLWEAPLAVNGDADESNLAALTEVQLAEMLAPSDTVTAPADDAATAPAAKPKTSAAPAYRWIPRGSQISLEGSSVSGMNLWRWLAQLVLVCLLAELVVLSWPISWGRLAVIVLIGIALLRLTSGTPVGTVEVVAQYTVLALGLLTVGLLLALHWMRRGDLETA